MANIEVKLSGDNSQFRGMLDDSTTRVAKFGRSIADLLPAVSAAAVVGFFKSVVDEASKLQDLSDRLQVSTDALQAFQRMVQLAGGTSEEAASIWDKSRKALDELAAGVPAMTANFAKLGLSLEDFIGLNYEEALEKTAKGYAANADAAGAYNAMLEIMGKAFPKLEASMLQIAEVGIPALKKATDGMMSSETITFLDNLGDSFSKIATAAKTAGGEGLHAVVTTLGKIGAMPGEIAAEMMNLWDGIETAAPPAAATAEKSLKKIGAATTENAEKSKAAHDEAVKNHVAEMDGIDKLNAKKIAAHIAEMDAKDKLIKKAIEQAKAEAKVLSAMEEQITAIQKMGGAGTGGFMAGPGGGGTGKTTVAALENVLANAKNAFAEIQKNPNSKTFAADYVQLQALIAQSEQNLQYGKNAQGFSTPKEINVSELNFENVSAISDAAFGAKEAMTLQQQLVKIAADSDMTLKQIQASAAAIQSVL